MALLAASCSSEAPDIVDPSEGSEVSFDVADQSQSRGAVITSFDKFVVYGDMKLPEDKITPPVVVFNETEVERINGGWAYAGAQYWFPSHEHSFVAITPQSALGVVDNHLYSNSSFSFDYNTPTTDGGVLNHKDLTDILVATHRRMNPGNASSPADPVRFNFHHILSRIDFRLINDKAADRVNVSKIVLEGVNKTGSFTITPAPLSSGARQTDDYNLLWTGVSNKVTLTANLNIDVPEDESRSLFPDYNGLFVIPQPDNEDVIMHITYTMYDANSEPETLTLTAETPIGGWQAGKAYTYSFIVEEATKEIYLTVSVKGWQSPKEPTPVTVPES